MNHYCFRQSIVFVLIVVSCHLGCTGNSRSKYVPNSAKARDALKMALDSWKSGGANKPITTPNGTINVFDARWRDGKKLLSYEILEEVKNAEQPEFKVRMQLEQEPEETLSYLVIGLDPLNVFRDVDFKQTQTW